MDDSPDHPADDPTDLLEAGAPAAAARLDALAAAPADERKAALRSLRALAEERPAALEPVADSLAPFLTDDERSVRLTAAKLFAGVAADAPAAVEPVAPALADRLADDGEFYYVRARAAEALGYVALERPDAASPEVLADLRVGLAFDEPEVREKLAKALELVSLGNPERLGSVASRLTDHLDDGSELVRYHLCTALAAVACERPGAAADAADALVARLDDESAHVRGRAAEALGVLGRADAGDASLARAEATLASAAAADESFAADRAAFAARALRGDDPDGTGVGTVASLRATTADAVDAMTAPEDGRECPHCGASVPASGPPLCPGCGAPH